MAWAIALVATTLGGVSVRVWSEVSLARYSVDPASYQLVENPLLTNVHAITADPPQSPLLLTFDDGPQDAAVDAQILQVLRRHSARSLWFVNCKNFDPALNPDAAKNRQTLLEIVRQGHMVGNHTYTHARLKDFRAADFQDLGREIRDCSDAIAAVVGKRPEFFRAPWGEFTVSALHVARESGMAPLGWSRNSNDMSYQPRPQFFRPFLLGPPGGGLADSVQSGDNILMHDIELTAEALDDFLDRLERRGFVFTVPG